MVLNDTRQVGLTPMGSVLKIQSKGKGKRALLSRTWITSPPQIRHTTDLLSEWERGLRYIKVQVFYILSRFPQHPLGSSPSIDCKPGKEKASPDFTPDVVGRGNDVKANITTKESPQTENQNYSSSAGPAGRKRDRKGHLDQPLLRADKEQLS